MSAPRVRIAPSESSPSSDTGTSRGRFGNRAGEQLLLLGGGDGVAVQPVGDGCLDHDCQSAAVEFAVAVQWEFGDDGEVCGQRLLGQAGLRLGAYPCQEGGGIGIVIAAHQGRDEDVVVGLFEDRRGCGLDSDAVAQLGVHFAELDPVSPDLDLVVLAAAVAESAVGVERAQVAGAIHTLAGVGVGKERAVAVALIPVAECDSDARNTDLSLDARGTGLEGGGVPDLDGVAGQDGSQADLFEARRHIGRGDFGAAQEHGGFRGAVHVEQAEPGAGDFEQMLGGPGGQCLADGQPPGDSGQGREITHRAYQRPCERRHHCHHVDLVLDDRAEQRGHVANVVGDNDGPARCRRQQQFRNGRVEGESGAVEDPLDVLQLGALDQGLDEVRDALVRKHHTLGTSRRAGRVQNIDRVGCLDGLRTDGGGMRQQPGDGDSIAQPGFVADDTDLRVGILQHELGPLLRLADVDGDVGGASKHDSEDGSELVEPGGQLDDDPATALDAEVQKSGGDPPDPIREFTIGERTLVRDDGGPCRLARRPCREQARNGAGERLGCGGAAEHHQGSSGRR